MSLAVGLSLSGAVDTEVSAGTQAIGHPYAHVSPRKQRFARWCYVAAYGTHFTVMGRQGFRKFLKNHKRDRGMDFDHDVHVWLDGYPYEAALITEVEK